MTGRLYLGDNLEVLPRHVAEGSVDLVYLDPPFASGATYDLLRPEPGGRPAGAPAFGDVWTWDERAEAGWSETCRADAGVARALEAFHGLLGPSPLLAYLAMMAPRLLELRRVLAPSGSIYLHCDGSAAHYLKVLMDAVFGMENFLNNIVWLYGLGGSSPRYWPRKHDDLLWYSRTPDGHWFEPAMVPARSVRLRGQDKKAPDWWDIPAVNNMARERRGYPTQKPLALLRRIVGSSAPPAGLVLDPFCGSGTTLVAAAELGRRWTGIDRAEVAVETSAARLRELDGDETLWSPGPDRRTDFEVVTVAADPAPQGTAGQSHP